MHPDSGPQLEHATLPSQLLVRAARPADRLAAAALLADARWSAEQIEGWHAGLPALVLYDPADGTVHGAVLARRRARGVFDLIAWAVAASVERRSAAARLVRSLADRVVREGCEQIVITVDDRGAAELLEASGFEPVPVAGERSPHEQNVVTYLLEL